VSDKLKFPLTDVKEKGEQPARASVPAADFPDALSEGELVGTVELDGMIRPIDDEASFDGTASGRWKFECSRCLEPVERAWSTELSVLVPIDGGPMDLTDEVRQAIALAQPMKVVCKDDCKGLCRTCRADRNKKDCGHPETAAGDGVPGGTFPTTKPRLTRKPHKG
jgi:uncharacterized protein